MKTVAKVLLIIIAMPVALFVFLLASVVAVERGLIYVPTLFCAVFSALMLAVLAALTRLRRNANGGRSIGKHSLIGVSVVCIVAITIATVSYVAARLHAERNPVRPRSEGSPTESVPSINTESNSQTAPAKKVRKRQRTKRKGGK
jgi:hypothetical protein